MFVEDAITGQLRVVAPHRAKRLGPRPDGCPFCAGHEYQTPPEIDRLTDESGDWRARSVPNLFPLSDVHEVLIPTPRHVTTIRDLDEQEWLNLAELWVRRLAAHDEAHRERYGHLFVNDGKAAGASLPHTHAQLVSVPRSGQILDLTAHVRVADSCAACAMLACDDDLVIARPDGFVLRAHATPRTGGGMLLLADSHVTSVHDCNVVHLGRALATAVQCVPPGDFNCWLVHDPASGAHVYAEFVPRAAIPAGVEMALAVGVSIIDPAQAAGAARERLAATARA